ncbi:MAG: hypothetical protein AAFQ94_26210 [Bacteroidota bacterium]
MASAETISLIVEISLIGGVIALIALAISRPKEFFRTIFVDFPTAVYKEASERLVLVTILLAMPFIFIWEVFSRKRKTKEDPSKH